MTIARIRPTRGICLSVLALSIATTIVGIARATEPPDMSYWISMRGITEDAQATFVVAKYVPQAGYTTPLLGCRNRTYYLSAADAGTVNAARAAGETVQIHWGEPGTSASASAVICLLQADK